MEASQKEQILALVAASRLPTREMLPGWVCPRALTVAGADEITLAGWRTTCQPSKTPQGPHNDSDCTSSQEVVYSPSRRENLSIRSMLAGHGMLPLQTPYYVQRWALMSNQDEVRLANEQHWDKMVTEGCGFTVPWLDLDVSLIRQYARGGLEAVPEPLDAMWVSAQITDPTWVSSLLANIEGKDVLCLALGGGQQSAVYGLLGARVTVLDLSEGQLKGDRRAAAHYGYEVSTIHADMRDLSCLGDECFDLVHGTAMGYVPDLREVYAGLARVLRSCGLFCANFNQPAIHFLEWNGEAYSISRPYAERIDRRADGAIEFRHYMDDIFGGLIDAGFSIQPVHEEPRRLPRDHEARPGSWTHQQTYVQGGFAVIARKEGTANSAKRFSSRG